MRYEVGHSSLLEYYLVVQVKSQIKKSAHRHLRFGWKVYLILGIHSWEIRLHYEYSHTVQEIKHQFSIEFSNDFGIYKLLIFLK